MNDIKLTFLGGAGGIGASCTLLEVCGHTLLIDCGVRFDSKAPLPDLDRLSGKQVDAMLVTHAHSDHTGALPVVHSLFPAAPILMTPPTFDLIGILQKDALKLMDLAFQKEGELPLYQQSQVENMLGRVRPIHHLDKWTLGDLEIRFLPASHILGASMIHITTSRGRILFTGDFSVSAQKTVPALDRPPFPVDLLVTESTYGARLHSDRKAAESALIANICEVVMSGGRVLIPCFAIGRAQEVLLIVREAMQRKKLPQAPVFVDGMVRYVCNIYNGHDRYVSRTVATASKRGHVFYDRNIQPVSDPKERQKVLQTSPCIIIASSGMLSGGPSAYYASYLAPTAGDAIFITGYQDEESPGNALLAVAEEEEEKTIVLDEKKVEVRCHFGTYGLSAHADRMQICGLSSAFCPKTVVLVHGDAQARQSLKTVLECQDIENGWDGLVVKRSYRARASQTVPSLPVVTAEGVKSLIGDDPGPFKERVLAEALLGRRVSREALAIFAAQVEATGLLKRDDNRRSLFKRVKTIESDDSELAEAIKQENPKGRLNEMCLKNRVTQPEKRLVKRENGRYCCILTVFIAGKTLETSLHTADSKILAEQLASRELLEKIEPLLCDFQKPQEPKIRQAPTEEKINVVPALPKSKYAIDINARGVINNLLQIGTLSDFQCQLVEKLGPSHDPVFAMCAKATLKNGTTVISETVQASTKKEAQGMAVTALVEALKKSPNFEPKISCKKRDHLDKEILSALITMIQGYDSHYGCRLPFKYLKRLAKRVFQHKKISQQEWIERELAQAHELWEVEKTQAARKNGYFPFIQFTSDIYHAISEEYGEWVLDMMKECLEDPARIFPNWAAQFAAAMNEIGREECEKQRNDLYHFIITHPAWEQSSQARERLTKALAKIKLQKICHLQK